LEKDEGWLLAFFSEMQLRNVVNIIGVVGLFRDTAANGYRQAQKQLVIFHCNFKRYNM